jgi:hypothetical protein
MTIDLPDFDRNDRGRGAFRNYRYELRPNNARVRIRLAGSNDSQVELAEIFAEKSALETAISRRNQQQDAVDAPIEVRLFTGSRVTGPLGFIPRGLESVVDEALSRLDMRGRKARIPAQIVRQRGRYRVDLLIGLIR